MCRIMEEFAKEERKEATEKRTIEMATKLLESGDMTEERLQELFKLTAKQMNAIKLFWHNYLIVSVNYCFAKLPTPLFHKNIGVGNFK